MDVRWFKIRSWHAEKFVSRGGMPKAYCGRWGTLASEWAEELPSGQKSCESCLANLARATDG